MLNGWKVAVDAVAARTTLMQLLEGQQSDLQHIVPWIRGALRRL